MTAARSDLLTLREWTLYKRHRIGHCNRASRGLQFLGHVMTYPYVSGVGQAHVLETCSSVMRLNHTMIRSSSVLRWRERGGKCTKCSFWFSPISLLLERYSFFSSLRAPSAPGMGPVQEAQQKNSWENTRSKFGAQSRPPERTRFYNDKPPNLPNLVCTTLTSELVRVKRKYLQLCQSSERLGNGPYISSTAAGHVFSCHGNRSPFQYASPTNLRRIVLARPDTWQHVNVHLGGAGNHIILCSSCVGGDRRGRRAPLPLGSLSPVSLLLDKRSFCSSPRASSASGMAPAQAAEQ